MDKQKDTTLLKARSYRSILTTGFRLYIENFRRLFKASWQMALLYALCCGAMGTMATIKIPEITLALMQQLAVFQGFFLETLKQYGVTLLELSGLVLLAFATETLASATILSKLKEHKETGTITMPLHWLTASPHLMGRTLKGCFLTLFVMALPLLLFFALLAVAEMMSPQFFLRHLMTTIGAFAVCTLIALMLELPLMHVLMKYLMEAPCNYWRTLGRNYGRGLSHWGSMFLVFFVSLLMVALFSFIISMPANILQFANQTAQTGLLMGDPLGMPSYMTALTFVTFTFCSFLNFYVCQTTLVHNYYIYGSIETKEYEKDIVH